MIENYKAVGLSHKPQLPDRRPIDVQAEAGCPWLLRHMFCVRVTVMVHTQASPRAIFGGKSGTEVGLSPSTSVLPSRDPHSTNASYSFIYHR
jgi:hypothetical protein